MASTSVFILLYLESHNGEYERVQYNREPSRSLKVKEDTEKKISKCLKFFFSVLIFLLRQNVGFLKSLSPF